MTLGAYRTDEGLPWILPSVQAAMDKVNKEMKDIEYLPPIGDPEFLNLAWKTAYGEKSWNWESGNIAGCQTISGTGALFIGFKFAEDWWHGNRSQIYLPNPTFPVHNSMAASLGFRVVQMPYHCQETNTLDFENYTKSMLNAPDRSIFLLHACAHNPTGIDPSNEQWEKISEIFEEKGHLAFFDMAYQGFASGCLEEDAKALRLWQEKRLPFLLAQSFSKNMGLYGFRTGTFSVPCENKDQVDIITSEVSDYVVNSWCFPPKYGCTIAKTILQDEKLRKMWLNDLKIMSSRINKMRWDLRTAIEKRGEIYFFV